MSFEVSTDHGVLRRHLDQIIRRVDTTENTDYHQPPTIIEQPIVEIAQHPTAVAAGVSETPTGPDDQAAAQPVETSQPSIDQTEPGADGETPATVTRPVRQRRVPEKFKDYDLGLLFKLEGE